MEHAYVGTEERRWTLPPIEQQAELVEKHELETLLFCPDPWALRNMFINQETGEVVRARCNRWECRYCGPRKVDVWRQLVKAADPVLFLTLTKAGKTVEAAARALTTFIQALRRGSKGRGPNHIGAREAYPIEYFAVLERHNDFERNGFHWHLLLKGVEHIPYKEVIQPLWMSATHYRPATDEDEGAGAMIAHIERIRNVRAIGYVTKYLTKAVAIAEKGTRAVERERVGVVEDDQGIAHVEVQAMMQDVTSKARRIRYSRRFFPEQVAVLRAKLFEGVEQIAMEPGENSKPLEEKAEKQPSSWCLMEREDKGQVDLEDYKQRRYGELMEGLAGMRETDAKEFQQHKRGILAQVMKEERVLKQGTYQRRKREALFEALEEVREDRRHLSRRVISIWAYQRQQLRLAG